MKKVGILYFGVLIGIISLFCLSLFKEYEGIKVNLKDATGYYNNLFASSVHATLHEIEMSFNLIGNQLLADDIYKDSHRSEEVLSKTAQQFRSVPGFGLISPKGDYTALSSKLDISKVKGLYEREETKESFSRTLTSNKMVLGRVYFYKQTKEWVLPLRKAVRDASGKVVAVVATGLVLNNSSGFLKYDPIYPGQGSFLINDVGLWRVFIHPLPTEDYERYYLTPMSREIYDRAVKVGGAALGISLNSIKETETSFSFEGYGEITGDAYMTIKYNKRYQLWTATAIPKNTLTTLFLDREFYLKLITFIISLIVFFTLFITILRKEAKAKKDLSYRATHDSLTGLYNRETLKELSKSWLCPNAEPFVLLFVDLDNFKNINDTFGHACGDVILVEVATRLKQFVPEGSKLIRHGGDEFAILIKIKAITTVNSLGLGVIKVISEPYSVSGMTLHIGSSVGISRFPEDAMGLEQLMITADLAMYDAKKNRNSYSFYCDSLQEEMQRKTTIENQLRKGLLNSELFMVFQPQIKNDGSIYGAEALVRWQSPELGLVPPDQFISIAEESGLMSQLGDFIIERSCADYSHIIQTSGECGTKLSLSINISVKQIIEKDFKNKFMQMLEKYQLKPNRVTIEITESLFIDDLDYILPLLREIRATGVCISLDDFGTGYSSLSMLRTLPIDELKIDRSFVSNINEVEQDSKMARSIVGIGHTMMMNVLAEGVEDENQLKLLKSYGCDLYQGYYFSRPLSTEDFLVFLMNYKNI
ncbi:MAG: EAL domain-containing protein [Desulfotalea sp.]